MKLKIEKTRPKFILDHITDLRKAGVSDELVKEIEMLADRCVPQKPAGGGVNANGNELRYKCPRCGRVVRGWQYNDHRAMDIICPDCEQKIDWWG